MQQLLTILIDESQHLLTLSSRNLSFIITKHVAETKDCIQGSS